MQAEKWFADLQDRLECVLKPSNDLITQHPIMDQIFVTPTNSYVEAPTPNVMLFTNEALGRYLGLS